METIQTQNPQLQSAPMDLDQMQRQKPPTSQSILGGTVLPASQSSVSSLEPVSEVTDTNPHTSNLEFYGASSSVSFLRHLESMSNSHVSGSIEPGPPERSLPSLLHSYEFRPASMQHTSSPETSSRTPADRFYFRVAPRFLDAYFSNLHHIQPLFDEESFLSRCESLWFNNPEQPPLSFLALYYATLSLGCLVTTSEDWEKHGCHRSTWSRKLLGEALSVVNQFGSATDIEIAQCYYMIVSFWRLSNRDLETDGRLTTEQGVSA
jgi:hypothetical protein